MGKMERLHTYTDIPVVDASGDQLGIEKYVDGLSKFIKSCETPMTIAIQGDWGSGKTSMMNMVKQRMEAGSNIKSIWFNTWQYSQFDGGEQLSVLFINDLVDKLAADDAESKKLKKAVGLLKTVTLAAADKLVGERVSDFLDSELEENKGKSASELMVNFKKQFQGCIDKIVKEKRADRVVVFVDDLDRLNPARAVELLEVLKLFLDCTNCVYVLAIDYGVVLRGTRDKFGDIEESKGRNFFDKIIQVPFKMPVATYDIKSYVNRMLEELSIHITAKKYQEQLITFIQNTTGTNPRSMKRLFNLYSLLDIIAGSESDERRKSILLSLLCLQHSYDDLYDMIAENRSALSETDLEAMAGEKDLHELSEDLQKMLEEHGITADNWEKYSDLMEKFIGLVVSNPSAGITKEDMAVLRQVITVSSITATGNQDGAEKAGRGARHSHEWDSTFSLYPISASLEKENAPTGWDNAKIRSFTLQGERVEVETFAAMLQQVLGRLYQRDPAQFMRVRENASVRILETLFYGTKRTGLNVPLAIPRTDMAVEGKTGNGAKVRELRALLDALGIAQSQLLLELKLAHRIEQ